MWQPWVNFERCSSGDGHLVFRETVSFTGTSVVLGCLATELSASAFPVTDGTAPQATCLLLPQSFVWVPENKLRSTGLSGKAFAISQPLTAHFKCLQCSIRTQQLPRSKLWFTSQPHPPLISGNNDFQFSPREDFC